MTHARFQVARTPRGGLSIGWSAYSTYTDCARRMQLGYLEGGAGIQARDRQPGEPLLYGSAWHAGVLGRMLGRDDAASWRAVRAEWPDYDGMDGLLDEVARDLDWFAQSSGGPLLRSEVLLAEQELRADVGVHEMRGTIDLLVRLPAEWGGRTAVLDWKTVDAYRGLNDSRAFERHRTSAQPTFYLALLARAMPHLATNDALLVLVPRFVRRTLERIAAPSFKGKTKAEDVAVKPVWALRTADALDEIAGEFESACDTMLAAMGGEGAWARNYSACVKAYGACEFLRVCSAAPALRAATIDELYVQRTFDNPAEDE